MKFRSLRHAGAPRTNADRTRLGRRVIAECLERRVLLTANAWKAPVSGDYDTPANWSLGHVPLGTEDVTITVAGSYTVTHSTSTTEPVHSLTTSALLNFAAGAMSVATTFTANNNVTFAGANALSCADMVLGGGHVVQLGGASGSSTITFNGTGAGHGLSGTGQILLAGTNPAADYIQVAALAATPFTIGSSVAIHGSGGNISDAYGQLGIINQGTITADAAAPFGRVFTLSGVINKGTIKAMNSALMTVNGFSNTAGKTISAITGSSLTFGGAWSNAGTIVENAATLNLGGTFTQSGLGTMTRTGGTVNLTGVDDVAGGALTFTAATGSWNLHGGTVKNATVTFTGTNKLIPTSFSGTLDNVKLASDLLVPGTTSVTASNGLTLVNHNITLGDATGTASLSFNGSGPVQTVTGTGQILFAGSNPASNYIQVVALAATPFVIGAGVTIHGAAGSISDAYGQLGIINQGTISADAAAPFSGALIVGGIINKGTLKAVGGGSMTLNDFTNTAGKTISISGTGSMTLGGTWTNAGTISETTSTLNLGGTFTQSTLGTIVRTGGTVNLTGIDDLGGAALTFTAASGSWFLKGGTIKNTKITFTGTNRLILTGSGGTLDNVTLASDLAAPGNTSFTAAHTLTLMSHNITLGDATGGATLSLNSSSGAGSLAGTGQIIFGGSSPSSDTIQVVALAATPFTIGSGITIHGTAGNISDAYGQQGIVNQGTITADSAAPSSAVLNISGIINKGTIKAVNSSLMTISNFANTAGKTISVTTGATLSLSGSWSSAGTIIENAATLNLGGTFTKAGLGTLTRTGGTINLTGIEDAAGGAVTFTAVTGSWNLRSGTMKNATLTFTGANQLLTTNVGGTLDNVKLASDLPIPFGTSLTSINTLTLASHNITLGSAAGSATITFGNGTGGQSLIGTGQLIFAGANPSTNTVQVVALAASPFIIGSGITIHGPAGSISDAYGQLGIMNQGKILADATGASGTAITLSGVVNAGTIQATLGKITISGSFNNQGTLAAIGGDIAANLFSPSTFTNNGLINLAGTHMLTFVSGTTVPLVNSPTGVLAGTGTIAANVDNSGTISPGPVAVAPASTIGTLHIKGPFTQGSLGVVKVELGGAASFDKLAVTGAATLAGLLDVYLVNSFHPAVGNKFAVVSGASLSGNFTTTDGTNLGGGVALTEAKSGAQIVLTAIKAPTDAVAPTLNIPPVLDAVSAGATSITFKIAFADNVAIDTSSLFSGGIVVKNAGLSFTKTATLVSVSKSNNGTPRTATFSITPPGGTLDFNDNGVYTVTLLAGKIKDTSGNAVVAAVLGSFTISVPKT